LLGSTAALHDGLADRDGAFASTLRGVKTFIETAAEEAISVHVTARVPVCRHNLHDVPSTVISAAEAGASAVYLIIEDTDLDLRAAAPWLEAACDSGVVNSAWVDVEGMPVGLALGWELHLASLYRSVAGAKSSRCATCALNDVCGGAVRGATNAVVSSFRPPADAHRLAERIARSFEPPECEHA
jgi:MoaA/NifB/PqqE/SkfB family radical SAM enzyme